MAGKEGIHISWDMIHRLCPLGSIWEITFVPDVVSEICTFVMKVFNVHFLWDKGHARLSQERLNGPFKREMYLGGLSVRYIYNIYT